MSEPPAALRLLHLEDSELDHELALVQLQRSGLRVRALRVETREEFEAALAQHWDAIVSDYNLPGFSGLQALRLVRARDPILPFVLVSGEIGEDLAVAAMRDGASDYLLKSGLARLAPALEHAIDAARTRAAKLEADRELAESRRRLAELARHLQTRIEAERAAIAREIHDDVGGSLTALKFDIDWIRRHSPDPAVRQRAASALETVTHAIGASQRIMHNLRPAILEQGLVAALQWLAGRFEKRTGVECVFRTRDERIGTAGRELPDGVPLVAYRTAQEALTNISKHACAQRVTMDLSLSGGVLSLEISDDGRGLRPADLAKASSFGIRGLHERAGTVGGWIELGSSDSGTTLLLSIPLDAQPPHAAPGGTGADGANDDEDREHDPSAWSSL
ncbi:MAG TPA: histidine kinase [Rubrivivax sp.]|nr:histidine kinase [Burkholderiales bacterium]HNT40479.1 histidine kinase [Rubrivivax sp.]